MIKPLSSQRANSNADESRDYDDRLRGVLELLSLSPLDGIRTLLDIGCGNGQIATWLCGLGKQVTATTLSRDAYGHAADELENKLGIKVEVCGAEAMPFSDSEFDGVVMSHVLEHCPNVQAALREVWRVRRRLASADEILRDETPANPSVLR
jgi:ubiquinone/menaquinone biosynthesis C-methylase UbiE